MRQTEQYVRQATRGLWGRARRELKTELEGHIAERCQDFRLAGLSAEEAERQTLRELGAPTRVSTGMLDVHTVPALGRAGVLSALLTTAVFSALPHGLAQVQSIYTSARGSGPASYLDFEQLKAEIRKAGGEVSGPAQTATITIPGAPRPNYPLNTAQWPGATLNQGNTVYLHADLLISSLLNTGSDLRLKGWKDLTLQAGNVSIPIATDNINVVKSFYGRTIDYSLDFMGDGMAFTTFEPTTINGSVTFRGKFQDGGIYALAVPELSYWTGASADGTAKDGYILLFNSVSQAENGLVRFQVKKNFVHYKLFANASSFQAALDPYRNIAVAPVLHWNAQHPAPVLLLKLSGHFGPDAYTVVSPSSMRHP